MVPTSAHTMLIHGIVLMKDERYYMCVVCGGCFWGPKGFETASTRSKMNKPLSVDVDPKPSWVLFVLPSIPPFWVQNMKFHDVPKNWNAYFRDDSSMVVVVVGSGLPVPTKMERITKCKRVDIRIHFWDWFFYLILWGDRVDLREKSTTRRSYCWQLSVKNILIPQEGRHYSNCGTLKTLMRCRSKRWLMWVHFSFLSVSGRL